MLYIYGCCLISLSLGKNGQLKLSVSSTKTFTATHPAGVTVNFWFASKVSCAGSRCTYRVHDWVPATRGFWLVKYGARCQRACPTVTVDSVEVNGVACSSTGPPKPTPPAGGSFDCKDVVEKLQGGTGQLRFRVSIDHKEPQNTRIVLTFNKRVGHIHTPAGNGRFSNGNKKYSVRLQRQYANQESKSIQFDGNYQGRKKPKLVSITYGSWSCKAGVKPTTPSTITLGGATCDAFRRVTQTQSNGEQGRLSIPVSKDLDGWYIEVRLYTFSMELL